jgi:hypothetical protein
VSGGSTELAPHAGLAAGSTTSEGATAATAAACDELVGRLKGAAEALEQDGKEVTWEAVVKGVCSPWEIITPKVRGVWWEHPQLEGGHCAVLYNAALHCSMQWCVAPTVWPAA